MWIWVVRAGMVKGVGKRDEIENFEDFFKVIFEL
jgi:hypothetical protein